MPRSPDNLTYVAEISATSIEEGEVRANLGYGEDGIGADSPIWGIASFAYRPADPDETGAAMTNVCVSGDNQRCIVTRDNRYSEKAGALNPGDSAILTTGPARVMVKDGNKSVTLFTENEKDDDSSQMVHVDGKQGSNTF